MIYKFTAQWCGSCLITNKNFKKVIAKYKDFDLQIDFQEIDIDDESKQSIELKEKYKVGQAEDILPVIVFTDDVGKEVCRLQGEQSQLEIVQGIDSYLYKIGEKSPSKSFKLSVKSGFLDKLSGIFGNG